MGIQHIDLTLQKVRDQGKKCFVPYIMAGDGGIDQLLPRLQFLEKAGATMIEIGIPFSDPAADGPVIQEAGIRALKSGTTLIAVLETMKDIREKVKIPLIIMTYLNPILAIGVENFVRRCDEVGIDACIIPDVPIEEEEDIKPFLKAYDIALIRLATLNSSKERIQYISDGAEGFLYAVTVKGVTGVRNGFAEDVKPYLRILKEVSAVPVIAGFGISSADHIKEMTDVCDGVIIGSYIVKCFNNGREQDIKQLISYSNSIY